MSQNILIEKFEWYLKEIIHKPHNGTPETFEQDTSQAQLIESFQGGACQGFSICHSAMAQVGKLAWWEACLKLIAQSEMDPETLDVEVELPEQIEVLTLRAIYERVINYVFFFQGCYSDFFSHFSQKDILNSETGLFEILDSSNEVKKITANDSIAADFSEAKLIQFLDKIKEKIEGNMCLIAGNKHATSLRYYQGQWQYYDPNDPHEDETIVPIHKSFEHQDTRNLVRAIFAAHRTQAVRITVASLEKGASLNLNQEWLKLFDTEFLEGKTLHVIASQTPGKLSMLFDFIKTLPIQKESFFSAIWQNSPEKERCLRYQCLATALSNRGDSGKTGLSIIADTAPELLPDLFDLIEKAPKQVQPMLYKHFVLALSLKDHMGDTGLYDICILARDQIPTLLKFIIAAPKSQHKNIYNLFSRALSTINANGSTGLHAILNADMNLDLLPLLLQLAEGITDRETKENFYLHFAQALSTENNYKKNCIASMILRNIDYSVTLMQFIEAAPEGVLLPVYRNFSLALQDGNLNGLLVSKLVHNTQKITELHWQSFGAIIAYIRWHTENQSLGHSNTGLRRAMKYFIELYKETDAINAKKLIKELLEESGTLNRSMWAFMQEKKAIKATNAPVTLFFQNRNTRDAMIRKLEQGISIQSPLRPPS